MPMQWRQPPLTQEEEDELFMLLLEDDTEDAPWMVMGDLQFWSASSFAHSLRNYAHEKGLGWYVASMHPILFTYGRSRKRHQLAPDVYVAFVDEHPRSSYDVAIEGSFPPFVLEVVSPASTDRDQVEKRDTYELAGVREYALFTPHLRSKATLQGYRRNAEGSFEEWRPDDMGRLWSEVLGLYLIVRGRLLQAQTAEGELLLTPEQAETERRRAEAERERAEAERDRAEAEVERLRRELERYRAQEK
jgi:Uma2 family endonuclease